MSAGRKLLMNVSKLGILKLSGDICVFVMFVALARHYGSDGIGEYAFAMAATSFVAFLCNFGFEFYAVREVSRDPARESAVFGSFLTLGACLGAFGFALVLGLAAMQGPGDRGALIASVGLYQIVYFLSDVVVGRFRAREEMGTVGLLELGLRVATLGAVLGAAALGFALRHAVWAFPLAAGCHIGIAAWILARRHPPLRWGIDRPMLTAAWPEVWPFGLALMLQSAYLKIDVLVLGALASAGDVGQYAAAFRPIFGLLTIVSFTASAAYPVFSRLHASSHEELREQLGRVVNYFLAALVLGSLACVCVAGSLIELLYGDGFEAAVRIFRILALDLVAAGLCAILQPFLGAVDRQRVFLRAMAIGVCLNTALNTLFVSRFGATGAALATLGSESFALFYLYQHVRAAGYGVGLPRMLGLAAGSGAAGFAVWQAARGFASSAPGEWLAAAAAVLACLAAMLLCGLLPRRDAARLWSLLRDARSARSLGASIRGAQLRKGGHG